MKTASGEIGPIHLLAEFVCDAIPVVAMESNVPPTSKKKKSKNGKHGKSDRPRSNAPNAKTKAKNHPTNKPKSDAKSAVKYI